MLVSGGGTIIKGLKIYKSRRLPSISGRCFFRDIN